MPIPRKICELTHNIFTMMNTKSDYFLSGAATSFHVHLTAVLGLYQLVIVASSITADTFRRFRADFYAACVSALVNVFPQLLHDFVDGRHALLVILDHRSIQYLVVSLQILYSLFLNLNKKIQIFN